MAEIAIGVIGGSGVYQFEDLRDIEQLHIATPFGAPSDELIVGTLGSRRVAFLPRHGRGHRFMPNEVPVRANIYAFKKLGVERIIAISAVGSLREDYAPLDIVIPDQLYDRTRNRQYTFFGDGVVAHVAFAEPYCPELSDVLFHSSMEAGAQTHKGGTLVVIEGPTFSTKAESRVNRQLGMDLVGMTSIPEAKLAREAEICYAAIAMVTDFDAWHESREVVTADMVVKSLLQNAEMGKKIVRGAVPQIPILRTSCPCHNALKDAIVTNPALIPAAARESLDLLIGKYLSKR